MSEPNQKEVQQNQKKWEIPARALLKFEPKLA